MGSRGRGRRTEVCVSVWWRRGCAYYIESLAYVFVSACTGAGVGGRVGGWGVGRATTTSLAYQTRNRDTAYSCKAEIYGICGQQRRLTSS